MPPAKVLQRLRWAAMRIGGITASFTVYFDSFVGFPTPFLWDLEQVVAASYGATQHEELECFKTEMLESESSPASSEGFSYWLHRLGVSLQAVCLHAESSCRSLRKGFGTPLFAQLRHLELCMPAFHRESYTAAGQLQVLETLQIVGNAYIGYSSEADCMDLSGCLHLRRLVLIKVVPRRLLKPDTCDLCYDVGYPLSNHMDTLWRVGLSALLGSAGQIVFDAIPLLTSPAACGVFGSFFQLKVLILKWSVSQGSLEYDLIIEHTRRYLLVNCMPLNGQPLEALRVLIITSAGGMKIVIPAGLPNLEELVISAKGPLELYFEDAGALFAFPSLTICYAFGQPLLPAGMPMLEILTYGALPGRDMTLRAVSASVEGDGSVEDSSGMCLCPISGQDLSIGELLKRVEQRTQCRCGACFDCLQRSGCIP